MTESLSRSDVLLNFSTRHLRPQGSVSRHRLFDPESPLLVRVLHAGEPVNIDDVWWRESPTSISVRTPWKAPGAILH
jgi:hypothetical protein